MRSQFIKGKQCRCKWFIDCVGPLGYWLRHELFVTSDLTSRRLTFECRLKSNTVQLLHNLFTKRMLLFVNTFRILTASEHFSYRLCPLVIIFIYEFVGVYYLFNIDRTHFLSHNTHFSCQYQFCFESTLIQSRTRLCLFVYDIFSKKDGRPDLEKIVFFK